VGGYSVYTGLDLAQGYFDDLVGSLDALAEDGTVLGSRTDYLTGNFTLYENEDCPMAGGLNEDIEAYSDAVKVRRKAGAKAGAKRRQYIIRSL